MRYFKVTFKKKLLEKNNYGGNKGKRQLLTENKIKQL